MFVYNNFLFTQTFCFSCLIGIAMLLKNTNYWLPRKVATIKTACKYQLLLRLKILSYGIFCIFESEIFFVTVVVVEVMCLKFSFLIFLFSYVICYFACV